MYTLQPTPLNTNQKLLIVALVVILHTFFVWVLLNVKPKEIEPPKAKTRPLDIQFIQAKPKSVPNPVQTSYQSQTVTKQSAVATSQSTTAQTKKPTIATPAIRNQPTSKNSQSTQKIQLTPRPHTLNDNHIPKNQTNTTKNTTTPPSPNDTTIVKPTAVVPTVAAKTLPKPTNQKPVSPDPINPNTATSNTNSPNTNSPNTNSPNTNDKTRQIATTEKMGKSSLKNQQENLGTKIAATSQAPTINKTIDNPKAKTKDKNMDANQIVDFSEGEIDWVSRPIHRLPMGVNLKSGEKVVVVLKLEVNKKGQIENLWIIKGSQNPRIDRQAQTETRHGKLTPFIVNGVIVKGRVNYTITY